MWTRHNEQQQRGVQLPPDRSPGEAVKDRDAQDHEQAGVDVPVGKSGYPASRLQDTRADNTPGAGAPRANPLMPDTTSGPSTTEESRNG